MPAERVIAIGGSAGAVDVVRAVLSGLPADLAAGVLVTIHLPPQSPGLLAWIFQQSTPLPVQQAVDGAVLEAGQVHVAVPDRHLVLTPAGLRTTRGPKECRARPSIDVMFRSAALEYGGAAMGVVLTGGLDDGTSGAWNIKDRGGRVVVQDPATAPFPSMPESVIRNVEVDAVLPVAAIAPDIVRWTRTPAARRATPVPARLAIEQRIATEENALMNGILELGPPSRFACPECHGVMFEVREGRGKRYRCHTGHAYSIESLMSEVDAAFGENLWQAVRAIDERILLLREMIDSLQALGQTAKLAEARDKLAEAMRRVETLRAFATESALGDAA